MVGKGKKLQKKGGKTAKRPQRPEPVSASSEGDEDLGEVRAFMARLEAKQKARVLCKAAERVRGGAGGSPGPLGRPTRQGKGAWLMEYLSSRRTAAQAPSSSGTIPDDQSVARSLEQNLNEE